MERELIEQVLLLCDGVQVTAAKRLGINRNTLHKKLSKFTDGSDAAPLEDAEARLKLYALAASPEIRNSKHEIRNKFQSEKFKESYAVS